MKFFLLLQSNATFVFTGTPVGNELTQCVRHVDVTSALLSPNQKLNSTLLSVRKLIWWVEQKRPTTGGQQTFFFFFFYILLAVSLSVQFFPLGWSCKDREKEVNMQKNHTIPTHDNVD